MEEQVAITSIIDAIQQVGILGVVVFMWYQERQNAIWWRTQYIELMNKAVKL